MSFSFDGAFGNLNRTIDADIQRRRAVDAGQQLSDAFLQSQSGGLSGMGTGQSAPAASSTPAAPPPSAGAPQGPQASNGVGAMLQQTNAAYGLPDGYLTKVAGIESNFNPQAVNKGSGAAGPFQFVPSTAAHYGLTDPTDWQQSATAAAKLAADNANVLRQGLGRDPTAGELYLAHQQGAQGALALLSNPNAPAGSVISPSHVASNGGDPRMPAGAFAAKWTSRFDGSQQPQQQAAQPQQPPAQMASADPSAAPPPGYQPTRQPDPQPQAFGPPANPPLPPPNPFRQDGAPAPGNDPEVAVPGYAGTWSKAKIDAAPDGTDVPDDGELARAQSAAAGGGTQNPQGAAPAGASVPLIPNRPPSPQPIAVSPQNGGINPQIIAGLLKNPDTQQVGMALWQQALGRKDYGFQVVGDQLVRTNALTGEAIPVPGINKPPTLSHFTGKDGGEYTFNPNTGAIAKLMDGEEGTTTVNPADYPKYNIPPDYKGVVQKDSDGKISFPTPPVATTSTPAQQAQSRKQAVIDAGGDPNSPENKSYIVYGEKPAKAQMGPTEEKLYAQDTDAVDNLKVALDQLQKAKELSPQVNSTNGVVNGVISGARRLWSDLNVAGGGQGSPSVAATTDYDNIIKSAQAAAAKSAIGGRVTQWDEKFFQGIGADSGKSPAEREKLIDGQIAVQTKRLQQAQDRLAAMKNGTFFAKTPGGTAAPAAQPLAPPNVGDVVKGYRFQGGDPAQPSSWAPAS